MRRLMIRWMTPSIERSLFGNSCRSSSECCSQWDLNSSEIADGPILCRWASDYDAIHALSAAL